MGDGRTMFSKTCGWVGEPFMKVGDGRTTVRLCVGCR